MRTGSGMKKPEKSLRIFSDTSALFSALHSNSGGSRELLILAEFGIVEIRLSRRVLGEIDRVLEKKYPKGKPLLAFILQQSRIQVVDDADEAEIEMYREITGHLQDAAILAEAVKSGCDALVTYDRNHLLTERVKQVVPLFIGTAGDVIQHFFSSKAFLKPYDEPPAPDSDH